MAYPAPSGREASDGYRVVSAVAGDGQRVDVPDGAVGVSVVPLPGSAVRVTYLQPTRPIPVTARTDDRSNAFY